MTINVRFFASLRERLGLERTEIQPDGISDVRSVWQAVSDLPLDEELLVAVNRNYASLEQAVEDGDEVAFSHRSRAVDGALACTLTFASKPSIPGRN